MTIVKFSPQGDILPILGVRLCPVLNKLIQGLDEKRSEDYIKKLMDESLEFKKPSEFKTPEEKMLKEASEKFRKGEISEATYESIIETLIEKKH